MAEGGDKSRCLLWGGEAAEGAGEVMGKRSTSSLEMDEEECDNRWKKEVRWCLERLGRV